MNKQTEQNRTEAIEAIHIPSITACPSQTASNAALEAIEFHI